MTSSAEGLNRAVSDVGRRATFSDPDTEVDRILRNKQNFYLVLKVVKDTDPAEIRTNYLKLSRLVHPDKCRHPHAADASAVVNSAKDTLTNPLKKRLYDAYVSDVAAGTAAGAGGEGMTYADWEAAQAQFPVKIPAWLETILRIPVVGQVFALILLVILLPLILVIVILILALMIVCLPVNIILRCLCGPPPSMDPETAQARAAFASAAHQPPPQAEAQRYAGNV